ncbi:hypothetical protein ACB092_03G131900 [Castanea dentata]
MWKNIWAGAESFFRQVVYAAERVIVFYSSTILGRKEMVGVAPNEGSRRRLPVWMLGVAAADQERKSDDVDKNNHQADEGLLPQACLSEAKNMTKAPGKGILVQEKGVNSHFLLKCETKKRRKASLQDSNLDGIITETVTKKKKDNKLGRKVREPTARKRKKANGSDFGRGEDFDIQLPNDDDVELTMDDLMTIAEEYVKAEKNKEQRVSNRECRSERTVPTTVSSSNVSVRLLDAPNGNQSLPTEEVTASHSSTVSLVSEEIAIIDRRTGDPAQDMLDLFLGPLLKKPFEQKNRSLIKDMEFAYEFEMQSQNTVVGEEIEPLMKKKSSLKDKVAMFLD